MHNRTVDRRPFPVLTSPRLRLRGLRPGDEDFLVLLDTDPVVMEYIHDGVLTQEEARRFAADQIYLASHRSHWGKWIVELGETPVGWVELGKLNGWDRDDLQVGYEFLPAYWGQGYAAEAVRAVMDYARAVLELDRVAALVRRENERSLRLLRKLGFAPEEGVTDPVADPAAEPLRLYCSLDTG